MKVALVHDWLTGMRGGEKRIVFSADGPGTLLDLSALQSVTAIFSGLGGLRQTIVYIEVMY